MPFPVPCVCVCVQLLEIQPGTFNYWVKGVKGRSAGLACREIPSKMIVNTNACEKVSLCNP